MEITMEFNLTAEIAVDFRPQTALSIDYNVPSSRQLSVSYNVPYSSQLLTNFEIPYYNLLNLDFEAPYYSLLGLNFEAPYVSLLSTAFISPASEILNLDFEVLQSSQLQLGFEVPFISQLTIDYSIEIASISGKVTQNCVAVEGAKVYLINEQTDELVGVEITDSQGDYSFELLSSYNTYHIVVSWTDTSGNKYNSESKPFVTPQIA